uniref:Uncharacterized protein n=1 Tax=Arundo donax TaxID=35708 RepID=A0A0A9FQT8_ARUDO
MLHTAEDNVVRVPRNQFGEMLFLCIAG